MSEPYVSVFEPEATPLRDAMEKLDLEPVNKVVKRATDDLYTHLMDSVNDYLASNLSDAIDDAARGIASRYLGEALAGDDKQLRQLFGCWYRHEPAAWSLIEGRYPDNWTLLRVLCEKFPDLLRTELLGQHETEIKALREKIGQLEKSNRELRDRL